MTDPFAGIETIVLYGVGLINGSLGLALRKHGFRGVRIGLGRRESSLRVALDRGAVDRATLDPSDALNGADVVVIGTPVDRIAASVARLAPHAPRSTLFTDVGSVKAQVMTECQRLAPASRFVGAHPIAGSHLTGVQAAQASLFEGTSCVVTPPQEPEPCDVERICALWRGVGSDVVVLPADTHDRLLAATSHLPHVVASALIRIVATCDEEGRRPLGFAGTGLRDTTRVAAGSPDVWEPILLYNASAIAPLLRTLSGELRRLADRIERGDASMIHEWLETARACRAQLEEQGKPHAE